MSSPYLADFSTITEAADDPWPLTQENNMTIGKEVLEHNMNELVLQKEVQLQGEGSTVKKQQHNAKERVRRMKLHAMYLALGALLPTDSSRSKKRKSTSAPWITDRAVNYIPELEEEIQKLALKKDHMLANIKNKQNPDFQLHQDDHPSVLVHEIKQGEFIIQICRQKNPDHDANFSNLLHKVEEEQGMSIFSASTLQVSDYGLCYHLHILQVNEISLNGANHLTSLREKVISWLR